MLTLAISRCKQTVHPGVTLTAHLLAVFSRRSLPSFEEIVRQLGHHQHTNHDLGEKPAMPS